ncbi:MAG: ABC transporter permease [Anaerolineae bacterium]
MRNTITIARREIESYFVSPIAYVTIAVFLFLMGFLFERILYLSREATLQYLFYNMVTILMLVSPLISMRLFAEENRSGTLELLLTSPVRDWEVVLGKYLAAIAVLVTALGLTGLYAVILAVVGRPEWGPVLTGYLGMLLFGSALLAVGLLTSSWTRNQVVAAFVAVIIVLFLWVIDALASSASGLLAGFASYISMSQHYEDFLNGVVDTRHVIYYLSIATAALFLTVRSVESRRWR